MTEHTTPNSGYNKPVVEEIGRLDRFVDSGYNINFNDSVKLTFPTGMYIYFETSKLSMANMNMG